MQQEGSCQEAAQPASAGSGLWVWTVSARMVGRTAYRWQGLPDSGPRPQDMFAMSASSRCPTYVQARVSNVFISQTTMRTYLQRFSRFNLTARNLFNPLIGLWIRLGTTRVVGDRNRNKIFERGRHFRDCFGHTWEERDKHGLPQTYDYRPQDQVEKSKGWPDDGTILLV